MVYESLSIRVICEILHRSHGLSSLLRIPPAEHTQIIQLPARVVGVISDLVHCPLLSLSALEKSQLIRSPNHGRSRMLHQRRQMVLEQSRNAYPLRVTYQGVSGTYPRSIYVFVIQPFSFHHKAHNSLLVELLIHLREVLVVCTLTTRDAFIGGLLLRHLIKATSICS